MSNTIDTWIVSPALEGFLRDVAAEARGAQRAEPGNADARLRVANAALWLDDAVRDCTAGRRAPVQVYARAVRLAAAVARLALGGDRGETYAFDMGMHEAMAQAMEATDGPRPDPDLHAGAALCASLARVAADARSPLESKW